MRTPVFVCLGLILIWAVGCSTGPSTSSTPPAPPATAGQLKSDAKEALPDWASRREAEMLSREGRYAEAVAIYDELVKAQPKDGDLVARLASGVDQQGIRETDTAKAKALRKRARELAEQAEKLGTKDPMPPLIIAAVNPDGSKRGDSKGAFSKREQVDEMMRSGEEAFTKGDFVRAGEFYQKAFEMEPTNYMAALYSGDAYFSARDMVKASEWFKKAIEIDPDRETAHRYLGDALNKLGNRKEAFDEWIKAVVRDPYQRTTRQHFTEQLQARAQAKGRVIPRFPAMRSKIQGKDIQLSLSPDDGMLIMVYNLTALGWREAEFVQHYPAEKTKRRSLLEEVAAIKAMLELAENADKDSKKDIEKWKPVVDGLVQLQKDDLLEAFILLERADKEIVADYPAYRAEHSDKLERYIRLYWCGFD
ncbi:MAG: tetratricopeptide repeat protein [Nibricoccus sp.]